MSTKILNSLRLEITSREKELQGLIDAFNLLSGSVKGRGRKSFINSTISSLIGSAVRPKGKKSKGTGKRGRPAGSKNKPNAKKPGPKSSKKSNAVKEAPKKRGPKKGAGRPKGSVRKAAGRPKNSARKAGRPKNKVAATSPSGTSENA